MGRGAYPNGVFGIGWPAVRKGSRSLSLSLSLCFESHVRGRHKQESEKHRHQQSLRSSNNPRVWVASYYSHTTCGCGWVGWYHAGCVPTNEISIWQTEQVKGPQVRTGDLWARVNSQELALVLAAQHDVLEVNRKEAAAEAAEDHTAITHVELVGRGVK
jgi:hypothetical protein